MTTETKTVEITTYLDKVVRPGRVDIDGNLYSVFCHIKYNDGRLSITGVEGPFRSGNCKGSYGQIESHLTIDEYAEGWNGITLQGFAEIWKRWHLNDMSAACQHQRDFGWTWATHASAICPMCGYSLGRSWMREELPEYVVQFLKGLPGTDKTPQWV